MENDSRWAGFRLVGQNPPGGQSSATPRSSGISIRSVIGISPRENQSRFTFVKRRNQNRCVWPLKTTLFFSHEVKIKESVFNEPIITRTSHLGPLGGSVGNRSEHGPTSLTQREDVRGLNPTPTDSHPCGGRLKKKSAFTELNPM